jgi:putative acetyltransferase
MNGIVIREIKKEDNQQIASVIREVFITDNFPKTGTAFADIQLDFMFEAYDKSRATYFVVENEGKIIGGAGISQLESSTENICELQKMYFLEEVRGKGIGFQMIQICLQFSKDWDGLIIGEIWYIVSHLLLSPIFHDFCNNFHT